MNKKGIQYISHSCVNVRLMDCGFIHLLHCDVRTSREFVVKDPIDIVHGIEHCVGYHSHDRADQERPVLGGLNNADRGEEEQTVNKVPHELRATIDAASIFFPLNIVVAVVESLWCPESRRQVAKSGGVGHEQTNHGRGHVVAGGAAKDHHYAYVRHQS